MQHTAKIFMNNGSRAVRLPKEFQFKTKEVFIRKGGEQCRPLPASLGLVLVLAEGPVASSAFLEEMQDRPVQER